jgi:hypothetical protein
MLLLIPSLRRLIRDREEAPSAEPLAVPAAQ